MSWLIATRTGRAVLAAGALLALLAAWTAYQRNDAASDAVSKIEEINDGLSQDAISARDARRLCVDAGGVWSFASSRCAENDS